MKKILTVFAILAFFSATFIGCKKEKTKTQADLIVGTWQVSKLTYNDHTNGADNIITTTNFTSSDTYEFTKDGTVNANVQGQSESSTYTIAAGKLTITGDDTYDIQALNEHALVIYSKSVTGSDYEEITITFKR
ncbi:MAG TPA: lipocalin family protein [Hanamia sp.]|nr:lipocalin family protein [Hanamia sp.]